MNLIKKALLATAFTVASSSALAAGLPFTIDPDLDDTTSGPKLGNFQADLISGTYFETVSLIPGGVTTNIFYALDTYIFDNATVPANSVTGIDRGNGHQLYAQFTIDADTTFGTEGFSLSNFRGNGSFFYRDLDADALNEYNASTAITENASFDADVGLLATDIKLGSLSSLTGGVEGGTLSSSASYNVFSTTFSLTTEGQDFFVEPKPFYELVFSTGDVSAILDDIQAFVNGSATQSSFSGTASVFFVPSPSTTGLVGLALLAIGFQARRRKQ